MSSRYKQPSTFSAIGTEDGLTVDADVEFGVVAVPVVGDAPVVDVGLDAVTEEVSVVTSLVVPVGIAELVGAAAVEGDELDVDVESSSLHAATASSAITGTIFAMRRMQDLPVPHRCSL